VGQRRRRPAAASAPPAAPVPAGGEVSGATLGLALGLLALALLPLTSGGYSGAGYQLGFVLLPLAAALCLPGLRLSRRAQVALLVVLASGLLLPLWLHSGRVLWYSVLALPAAWVVTWAALTSTPSNGAPWPAGRGRWLLPATTAGAVLTCLWGWFLWLGAGELSYQITSTFGLHNALAGYLLLAWPLAAIGAVRAAAARERALYTAAALLLAVTLVLTYSKASIVTLLGQLAVLGAYLLLQRSHAAVRGRFSAGLITAGAAAVALLLLPGVRGALLQLAELDSYSMLGRLRFWEAALRMFADRPLAGYGLGSFGYVFPQYQRDWLFYSVDPHSWPLQLLAELGLLGLLVVLAVGAGFFSWARSNWRGTRGPDRTAVLLTILGVGGSLAHAGFDFDYTFSATTALLGVLLALATWLRARGGTAAANERAETVAPPALQSEPAAPGALRWAAVGLLGLAVLYGQALTLERYVLDRLRQPDLRAEARVAALEQAVRYEPWNDETQLALGHALASSTGRTSDRAEALAQRAIQLNPRNAEAYALLGGLARRSAEAEANLAHAVELDPYNSPEFYYAWAMAAGSVEVKYDRLKLGVERIPAEHPITPEHPRGPDWYRLNGLWVNWWQQLAALEQDPALRKKYQGYAADFRQYVQRSAEAQAASQTDAEPQE
jgi:hypothetical protein